MANPFKAFLGASKNQKLMMQRARLLLPNRTLLRQVMASPPTITTGTSTGMGSPFLRAAASADGSRPLARSVSDVFTYSRGSLNSASLALGVAFNNVTVTPAPTYGACSFGVSFMHDGSSLELVLQQTSSYFLVKVDDQYVSLTPTSTGTTGGSNLYYKMDFGASKRRRIDLIGNNLAFIGVNINATDALDAAPIRGPRTICIGDSFTATAVGSSAGNYTLGISDCFGWDDVWASGVGGSGYLSTNGGTVPTFRSRVARDVIAFDPEIVWIVGTVNDYGTSAASVQAEALALYQQLVAGLPNALIIASPTASGGAKWWTTAALAVKAGLKAAAQQAGILWIDPTEMPILGSPLSGTIVNTQSAGTTGATGILIDFWPQPGCTLELGAAKERIQVKSFTNATSTIARIFFDGSLANSYVNGDPVVQVGSSYLTGTGKVGATTGYGNADRYVDTDGTHPTYDPGHTALGQVLCNLLVSGYGPN